MSGLVAARAAAARGISSWVRHIGRAWGRRRIRNWLIPPTTHRNAGWPLPRGEGRLAVVLVPVASSVRPVARRPFARGTSRPLAASIWWSHPPATLDSTIFGAPVSQAHSWPRRVFILTAIVGAILFCSASVFGQCCGPGFGPSCGPCGGSGCGSGCGMGSPMYSSSCGCPSGGCGFGCSAGCGCPQSPFGFGFFGGGRCGSPCSSCCGPACGGGCGSPCGRVCGPRCASMCGPACGSPCGPGPCGYAPCCGSPCGGPACGFACSPYGPGPCGSGPCGPGPCGSGPCAAGCCGSCVPSCAGAPGPCGAGCGPMPTYEVSPALPPGSTNGPGYPPAASPGDPIPGPAGTTIPKRPSQPPDDKGTHFERRPDGAAGAAAAPIDVTDNSDTSATEPSQPTRRLFRQSVSAGFRTRVLTAQAARTMSESRAAQTPPLQTETHDELARTE
jgi:hypothetical protein